MIYTYIRNRVAFSSAGKEKMSYVWLKVAVARNYFDVYFPIYIVRGVCWRMKRDDVILSMIKVQRINLNMVICSQSRMNSQQSLSQK